MQRLPILIACLVVGLLCTRDAFSQNKVYRTVSNDGLEKILQSFEIKYEKGEQKKDDKTSTMFFEFKRGEHSYRLNNYVRDLWIECIFEKSMPLEDVNRWNADAKFSRLVFVTLKDKMNKEKRFLSLEAQLDCKGGVTDAVIKQFIVRFEEETNRFAKFK